MRFGLPSVGGDFVTLCGTSDSEMMPISSIDPTAQKDILNRLTSIWVLRISALLLKTCQKKQEIWRVF
jgi:hypothetical protein